MDVATLGAALSIMKKMPDTAASSAAAAEDAADRAEEAARTFTIDDTLSKPGQPADSKAVGDALAGKLDIADLPDAASNANQLLSEKYTVDTEPYHSRPSGGNGADREFDTIVGGSVVWNQLVDDSDSSVTVTSGHKYIAKIDSAYSVAVSDGTAIAVTGGTDEVFDLTQMFGSEIADHIYELEQAEAGAGAAWFRKYFPKDYYEYNAGELMHVSDLQSHDVVGFNLWDGNLGKAGSTYRIIPLSPVLKTNLAYMAFKDKDTSIDVSNVAVGFINSNNSGASLQNSEFRWCKQATITSYTYNVSLQGNNKLDGIVIYPKSEDVFNRLMARYDICINLSGTRNGEYEPYKKNSYSLDSSLTLRGIPKLVDGKLSFDGDIYKPDGTVERRYGTRAYENGDESLSNAITDGTNTVYKLTTPTTEQAQSFQSPQILDPYGTEEYVTTSLVPVGHETKYPENLRAKIEGLPWDMGMIAPVEKTNKATRNYTAGRLLVLNNTLYKVTANIAKDGTITPGTNVTSTTLDEIIAALA